MCAQAVRRKLDGKRPERILDELDQSERLQLPFFLKYKIKLKLNFDFILLVLDHSSCFADHPELLIEVTATELLAVGTWNPTHSLSLCV